MTLHVVKYGTFVLWRQHIGMIITWSEKGKKSVESKDLSTAATACDSFNSGNEINRKLNKSQIFTFKRTQFQDISHSNSNTLHKVNSRLYFDEILHNHWYW